MNRKNIIVDLFFLLILTVLFVPNCSIQKEEKTNEKLLVRLGYNVQSLNYGPIMIAQEKGLFEIADMKIELVLLKSGKEVRQSLATGHLDMGLACPTDFFPLIAGGAPVKIIAPLTVTNIIVFVRADDEINSFEDFKGKRVSGGKGGHSEFVFRRALKKEGVNISDIEFIHIDNIFRGMALIDKKAIDVVPMSYYGGSDLTELGAVVHKGWLEKGYADEYWLNKVIGINTNFLRDHIDGVDKVIDAIIDAQKYIVTQKEESAKIISQHIKKGSDGVKNFSTDEIKRIWESGFRYILWCDPNILVEMSHMLFEVGLLKKELTLEQIYDSKYESKLKFAHNKIYESNN